MFMERCIVALSSNSNQNEAYSEIVMQLKAQNAVPKLLIVFSEKNILGYCAKQLQKDFPEATIIGSTTYVNFSSEGYSHSGLSVMAINDGIECVPGIIFEVDRYPELYKNHIKLSLEKLSSYENTCCLEFTTAFSTGEDLVLDTFEGVLKDTGITVVGGTSGSESDDNETFVTLNGELYRNTCVFVFIHNLNGKIKFFKENLFNSTKEKLVVTDVDCETQLVCELNSEPAAYKLAELLNVSVNELADEFENHPMGRIVNNDIFITEPNKVLEDGSVSFYTRIYNHTKMYILEHRDMNEVWKETSVRVKDEIPSISFCLSINCMLRSKYFEKNSKFGEFVNNLRQFGTFIGLSGYGEQLDYFTLNQTMILVVFE